MRRWRLKKDTLHYGDIVPAGTELRELTNAQVPYGGARYTSGPALGSIVRISSLESHPEWFSEIESKRVLVIECCWPWSGPLAEFEGVQSVTALVSKTPVRADVITARIEEREP